MIPRRCAFATAYRSAHDSLPEPLCAIWEPAAREPLQAYIDAGRQCPRKFLINANTLLLYLPQASALAHGTIRCPPAWERSRCLLKISQDLRAVIRQHNPAVCVVEGLFYAQNLQTALIMGEARGACLVAAAEAGLEVYEIAPRKVKQAIVGYGAAQKLAVAKMVQRLLSLSEPPESDAADALAVSICHAHHRATRLAFAKGYVPT